MMTRRSLLCLLSTLLAVTVGCGPNVGPEGAQASRAADRTAARLP